MINLDTLLPDLPLLLPTLFGLAGFAFYTLGQLSLALRWVTSEDVIYYLCTGTAACMITLSLMHSFNIGVFMTQAITMTTSLVAVTLRLRSARRKAPARPAVLQLDGMTGARPMPSRVGGLVCALTPDRID